jgi:hypothetical protein
MIIELDESQFSKSLDSIKNLSIESIRDALEDVGWQIAIETEKFVPIDEGTLVGSVNIAVDSRPVKKFEPVQKGKNPKETPDINQINQPNSYTHLLKVAYNTAYAKEIHDDYDKVVTPGVSSRKKYIKWGLIDDMEDFEGARKAGHEFLNNSIKINKQIFLNLLETRLRFYYKRRGLN